MTNTPANQMLKQLRTSWLMLLLLITPVAAQNVSDQFPEAPEPIQLRADGGLQHDRIVQEPRAITKWWLLAHGAELAANIADIELSQRAFQRGCIEAGFDAPGQQPGRREMYAVDMTIFGATTLFDWATAKLHPPKPFRWVPYLGVAFGTGYHLKGAIAAYGCGR